jgi:acyl-CoA dehydrogenase
MQSRHEVALPTVGLSGFDAGWSEEELGAQEAIHRFAKEVMRPLGREIDKMPADQAYLPGSPFWQFLVEAQKAGLDDNSAMEGMTAAQRARMEGIVIQELAWGDAGLAVVAGVGALPMQMAMATGNQELIDLCAGRLGCWCATQPDRGSDGLML